MLINDLSFRVQHSLSHSSSISHNEMNTIKTSLFALAILSTQAIVFAQCGCGGLPPPALPLPLPAPLPVPAPARK